MNRTQRRLPRFCLASNIANAEPRTKPEEPKGPPQHEIPIEEPSPTEIPSPVPGNEPTEVPGPEQNPTPEIEPPIQRLAAVPTAQINVVVNEQKRFRLIIQQTTAHTKFIIPLHG